VEPGAPKAFMPEGVVLAAPLRVAQDLIRLGGFLELGFGLGIPVVAVRVVLEGQPCDTPA
jgi:hypothetical protein